MKELFRCWSVNEQLGDLPGCGEPRYDRHLGFRLGPNVRFIRHGSSFKLLKEE